MYIVVNLDYFVLFGITKVVVDAKKTLSSLFTDLGCFYLFLELKEDFLTNGIDLSQKPYAEKVISMENKSTEKLVRSTLTLEHILYG